MQKVRCQSQMSCQPAYSVAHHRLDEPEMTPRIR